MSECWDIGIRVGINYLKLSKNLLNPPFLISDFFLSSGPFAIIPIEAKTLTCMRLLNNLKYGIT
jgi:hypothetical protein